jgi:hypothetical protein
MCPASGSAPRAMGESAPAGRSPHELPPGLVTSGFPRPGLHGRDRIVPRPLPRKRPLGDAAATQESVRRGRFHPRRRYYPDKCRPDTNGVTQTGASRSTSPAPSATTSCGDRHGDARGRVACTTLSDPRQASLKYRVVGESSTRSCEAGSVREQQVHTDYARHGRDRRQGQGQGKGVKEI